MSGLFGGGGGSSRPPAPPPVVTQNTEAVKEAARLEADRLRKRRGAASTILTGPAGVLGSAPGQQVTLG